MRSLCLLLLLFSQSNGQISTRINTHYQPLSLSLSSDLSACCSLLLSPSQLILCVNQSTSKRFESQNQEQGQGINQLIPYKLNKQGPKLFVSLLTRVTPQIFDYGSYSYFLQAAYAEQNGYALIPLYNDSKTEDYQLYRKLVPLQEALNGLSVDCDFIVWMDAGLNLSNLILIEIDIAILDLGMRIEKVVIEFLLHLLTSDLSRIP